MIIYVRVHLCTDYCASSIVTITIIFFFYFFIFIIIIIIIIIIIDRGGRLAWRVHITYITCTQVAQAGTAAGGGGRWIHVPN